MSNGAKRYNFSPPGSAVVYHRRALDNRYDESLGRAGGGDICVCGGGREPSDFGTNEGWPRSCSGTVQEARAPKGQQDKEEEKVKGDTAPDNARRIGCPCQRFQISNARSANSLALV